MIPTAPPAKTPPGARAGGSKRLLPSKDASMNTASTTTNLPMAQRSTRGCSASDNPKHRLLVGNVPQVVAEVLGELLAALPTELDDGRLWTAGPDLYCTYHRNFIDNGYPKRP